jgi:hypothetical protein
MHDYGSASLQARHTMCCLRIQSTAEAAKLQTAKEVPVLEFVWQTISIDALWPIHLNGAWFLSLIKAQRCSCPFV